MRLLLALALLALPALAQAPAGLRLTLVHFTGGGWTEGDIRSVAEQAAKILAQCAIAPGKMELLSIDVEPRFRQFYSPTSRELARKLQPRTPAVYFVDGTRQDPAFEAEAIGRGNRRTRAEMQDTA